MKHATDFTKANSMTIEADKMLVALTAVNLAIERRSSDTILFQVKIAASKGKAMIYGTNNDIEIVASVDLVGESNVTVMFDAKKLLMILKKAKGQTVTIANDHSENNYSNSIHFGSQSHAVNAGLVSDYPHIETTSKTPTTFSIDAPTLLDALNGVKNGMSKEETRYYLMGALFAKSETGIQLVTTDGHTLRNQQIECDAPDFEQVIVPRDTIDNLFKLLKNQSGDVSIKIWDRLAYFTFGNVKVITKIVDGTYPDWPRLVSTGEKIILTVDSKTLINGVDSAIIFNPKNGSCSFKMADGLLQLSHKDYENNSVNTIAANGDFDFEVGFKGRYVKEVMIDAGDGEAFFAMKDSGSPALVTGQRKGWFAIIMPMRV